MEGKHVLGFQRDPIRRTGAEWQGFKRGRMSLGVHERACEDLHVGCTSCYADE